MAKKATSETQRMSRDWPGPRRGDPPCRPKSRAQALSWENTRCPKDTRKKTIVAGGQGARRSMLEAGQDLQGRFSSVQYLIRV